MHARSLLYFLGEALKSVVRHGWMSIASIAVVSITLLILGSFMVINYNVTLLTEDIKDQMQIIVRMEDGADEQAHRALQRALVAHPDLVEVRFVSKDEAMERLKRQMGDQAFLLEGYAEQGKNPLRDSFELRTHIPEDIPRVAAELKEYAGVAYVDYGRGVVEPLFQFTGIVRWLGLVFMAGLAITATFLISHTIRLTVYIRRKEIMIMKYVGATDWFIRWPFIFEGLILGLVGALVPLVVIHYSYLAAAQWMQLNIRFISLVPAAEIMTELIRVLLVLGVALGVLGGTISVRRFLKA
ncbi:MAG TPA: ABC transporter permease [Firmicutes bacterium]|nr:ABC transporter permease [Bacillota bacterium]